MLHGGYQIVLDEEATDSEHVHSYCEPNDMTPLYKYFEIDSVPIAPIIERKLLAYGLETITVTLGLMSFAIIF